MLDASHTSIGFEVEHLAISTVEGRFDKFDGSFEIDDKSGALTGFLGTAVAASINTNNEKRDKHLSSADFFETEKYPQITLKATGLKISALSSATVKADLTMRGVTKSIDLDVKYRGTAKDPWGAEKAGFTARGKIKRADFGLKWNKLLEAGGVVVGETVDLILSVQGDKQTRK